MKAKTIKSSNPEELEQQLQASLSDGFAPTLALVFLSIRQDREAICRLLDEKGIAIFGASTAGEFIDGEVGEGSVAIMLLAIDPSLFSIRFIPINGEDQAGIARQIGEAGIKQFPNPAFLLSYSGLYTDGELLVNEIERVAGADAVIFGGMAGDDLTFTGPLVFTNGKESDKAVLALIINGDRITLKGHASSGWKPVGTERIVTRSEGSVVYSIDDEPALNVVMKFLDVKPGTTNEYNEVLAKMGSYFPILIQRGDGVQVVRTSMFANVQERSLKFSGNVPQGARFRFALPPDFDVVDDVIARTKEVKSGELHTADALIMFSCIARHVTLGPLVSDEIEGVMKVWNSPLVGFFSYGEIGKTANGKHEFHNNTCCLVAMKEKEPLTT